MATRKSYYSGKKVSPEQTANWLYQAGFRGDDLWKMTAIAGRESGYDPGAHGSERPQHELSGDRGLFQINYIWDKQLMAAGIIRSRSDLMNPATNARAAKYVFDKQGWPAWGAGPGGWQTGGQALYGTSRFTSAAKAAAAKATAARGGGAPSSSSSRPSSTPEPKMADIPKAPEAKVDPKAQAALTSMLERYGVSYPNAPAPTPAILAFMRGLGMTLDTAEDTTVQNNLRLNERAMQTREEISMNNDRALKRMAGDLQQRGVLSSGETNTRVARQAEDVALKMGDVEQTLAEGIERNDQAYNVTKDALRQSALEKTLSTETEQARTKAASEAQERSWQQQQAAADLAYKRQKAAQDAAYAAQEAAYRQYSF